MRVVARRHHDATDGRPPTHAAFVPRAADLAVLVLDVAELSDRRAAAHLHDANATRRKTDLRELAFLRDEPGPAAGRPHGRRAAAGLELDAVDRRAGRNVLERQAVAHARLGLGTGENGVADLELVRCEDVALLAIAVPEQREAGGAVRVVLDRQHARGDPVLVALEVHDPVSPFLAAAAVARGHAALRVAAGLTQLALGQALLGLVLRDLRVRRRLPEAADRCERFVLLQRHPLDPFHEVALDLLTFGDGDDGFLPVRSLTDAAAQAPLLAANGHGVHIDDVDLERLRHRGRDLLLRRVLDDLERDRKSTRLNSSHQIISYAVFCLKKKK